MAVPRTNSPSKMEKNVRDVALPLLQYEIEEYNLSQIKSSGSSSKGS